MGSKKQKQGEGTARDAAGYIPSKVHVDHARNYSRGLLIDAPPEIAKYLVGGKCGFTLAEIVERMNDFLARGQITPVSIYLTGTCDAHLVDGYLRHAAMLLAEVRGLLDKVPNAAGKLDCKIIREPKSPADLLALADRNFAENTVRLELSPVNKALYVQRLMQSVTEGGFGLSPADAAAKIGLTHPRQLARYVRLLKLAPDVLAKVHAGTLSHAAAMRAATEGGAAGSPGPRPYASRKAVGLALAHADKRPLPGVGLTASETRELLALFAGELTDDTSPNVRGGTTPSRRRASRSRRCARSRRPAKTESHAARRDASHRRRTPRKDSAAPTRLHVSANA